MIDGMPVQIHEKAKGYAVWLSGCLAVWLSGCLAVWLSADGGLLHLASQVTRLAHQGCAGVRLRVRAAKGGVQKLRSREAQAGFVPSRCM